jgi:DIS3-like exonuclease 2
VYLVQKVLPMLPPLLCEELCSLNPNLDRLAFSCVWRMNADGTLCSDSPPWFGKTVIRSCAKLDYPTAQRMIDGSIPLPPPGCPESSWLGGIAEQVWEASRRPISQSGAGCVRDVMDMAAIARRRRLLRLTNGAIVLTRSKLAFTLDAQGNPAECSTYQLRESNSLVEEYMLLANYLVAQELHRAVGPAAFLRNHPPPSANDLKKLTSLGSSLGVAIDVTSALTLQNSLSRIALMNDRLLLQLVTCVLTKPMKQAAYFVANDVTPSEMRHYALNIPCYTHFTSPIRRYADVLVHRLLEISITEPVEPVPTEVLGFLSRVADYCNEMKVAAKTAQERSDRVYLAVHLEKHPVVAEAIVTDLGSNSFTVLIPGTMHCCTL